MRSRRALGTLVPLLLAVVLVPAGSAGSAPPAASEAATTATALATVVETRKFDRSYTKTGTMELKPLGLCASYRLTGRIKATREKYRHYSGFGNRWKDVRVVEPQYRITTRKYLSHPTGYTCGDKVRVREFELRQIWKRSGCNPGLESVSIGWTPAATFGCSKRHAARRTSTYGAGRTVNQFNSSDVLRFKTFDCNGIQCAYAARARAFVKITRSTKDGMDSDTARRDVTVTLPALG